MLAGLGQATFEPTTHSGFGAAGEEETAGGERGSKMSPSPERP